MGLDTILFKTRIKPELEQVFDKLIEVEEKMEQVTSWRKNYALLEWFNENLCMIDNCEYYEVPKYLLEKWLDDLESGDLTYDMYDTDEENKEMILGDMGIIMKILKETDFTKIKFLFYNWW